jgi:hypothetical protein
MGQAADLVRTAFERANANDPGLDDLLRPRGRPGLAGHHHGNSRREDALAERDTA